MIRYSFIFLLSLCITFPPKVTQFLVEEMGVYLKWRWCTGMEREVKSSTGARPQSLIMVIEVAVMSWPLIPIRWIPKWSELSSQKTSRVWKKKLDISGQALLMLKQIPNHSLVPAYTICYISILIHSVFPIGMRASWGQRLCLTCLQMTRNIVHSNTHWASKWSGYKTPVNHKPVLLGWSGNI